MNLSHDLHMHTYLSACCSDRANHRPAPILALAREMGLSTLGFADHLWMHPDLEPSSWYRPQDASQVSRLRADLASISTPLRVLVGCEAETIAPGKFSITPDFAESLDFVLLAASHFHMDSLVAQPRSYAPQHLGPHALDFFLAAVRSGLATSIPHPFFPVGHHDAFDVAVAFLSDAQLFDAFSLAAERSVAVEITLAFLPRPDRVFSIETPLRLLSIARDAGCFFTLGSDAHAPDAQRRFPELMTFVETLALTDDDLLPLVR